MSTIKEFKFGNTLILSKFYNDASLESNTLYRFLKKYLKDMVKFSHYNVRGKIIYSLSFLSIFFKIENFEVSEGMYYNQWIDGNQIAMAPPLGEGYVDYDDGTNNTLPQLAEDVVTFLKWSAEPELEERKNLGIKVNFSSRENFTKDDISFTILR